ncbi:hypothetical protein [Serratia microhaemolytica]|uniref:hypothetical protein n=1 Tax=Serratia microhaemolytica TaxID=2675110 RepID=UPI000FDF3D83|nr:hypothetical protein [Serratia microhaemolytica]
MNPLKNAINPCKRLLPLLIHALKESMLFTPFFVMMSVVFFPTSGLIEIGQEMVDTTIEVKMGFAKHLILQAWMLTFTVSFFTALFVGIGNNISRKKGEYQDAAGDLSKEQESAAPVSGSTHWLPLWLPLDEPLWKRAHNLGQGDIYEGVKLALINIDLHEKDLKEEKR